MAVSELGAAGEMEVEDLESLRQANIARNKQQLKELGIFQQRVPVATVKSSSKPPAAKRRKVTALPPSRSSARIANAPARPSYNEDEAPIVVKSKSKAPRSKSTNTTVAASPIPKPNLPSADISDLRSQWGSYDVSASLPSRSEDGTFHFPSHPVFRPNKSPEEMIREGVFGGSYFRSLFSSHLRATIEDDWRDIPKAWYEGLDEQRFLTSPDYDPEVNKYGVKCGQSIEEWEAQGWIAHEYDPRGWFQWYCRFFLGRRCEDDERQVGRWDRCVGRMGRWRRMLLKKYMQMGVRECFDYGDDEDKGEVSPVMHQTCFQWAYEIKQDDLDEYWRSGR